MASATPLNVRFGTAADGDPPTEDQQHRVWQIKMATIQLAAYIDEFVPEGRNKSLALTNLEDTQMRANRGIFNP